MFTSTAPARKKQASFHRSHFGPRCKLGRCVLAGLFGAQLASDPARGGGRSANKKNLAKRKFQFLLFSLFSLPLRPKAHRTSSARDPHISRDAGSSSGSASRGGSSSSSRPPPPCVLPCALAFRLFVFNSQAIASVFKVPFRFFALDVFLASTSTRKKAAGENEAKREKMKKTLAIGYELKTNR